jgi:hypothetical protein
VLARETARCETGLWGFHVASGEQDPWWRVDLGQEYRLDRVVIYNRCGGAEARIGGLTREKPLVSPT